MDRWRPFDIKTFLKESRYWDDDIEKLKREQDALSLLPSSQDVPSAKTGTVSDITARAALRRLEISAQIEKIMLYKEILEYAFKTLSDKDRQLIEGFYYPKKSISYFISEYGHTYGMGRTMIYEERDRIEKQMARVIENHYYV